MNQPAYIPEKWNDRTMMQVRDGELALYRKPPDYETRTAESVAKQKELMLAAKQGTKIQPGAYSGAMTLGARKRMVKAVTLLCQATKPRWVTNPANGKMQYHRLSFLTLTVTSRKKITAKECYQSLLKHFTMWLRDTKGVRSYVWKAELQKDGTVHYHFIFPDFIHYKEIRMKWNELQRKAGMLDEYAQKHGHADPNSTDVHEMKNVRKTAKYVVKELGKDIDARKVQLKAQLKNDLKAGMIDEEMYGQALEDLEQDKFFTDGKIWASTENISGMGYFTMALTVRQDLLIKKWVEGGGEIPLFGEWWAVIDLKNNSPTDILNRAEKKIFENHIDIVRQGGKKYLRELELFNN